MTLQNPPPQATFHLPNARFGVHYDSPLSGRDFSGAPVRILEVALPDRLGLQFDPSTGHLTGTPADAGDYRLRLRWTTDGRTSHAGDCLLIVNPDPRSLWKIVEPPIDAPCPKPHLDSRLLTAGGRRIVAASRRGRSHEHVGGFREDDCFIRHDAYSGWSLLLVADGAGSAPCSREGSRLAVTTAGACLSENLTGALGAHLSAGLDRWGADSDAPPSLTAGFARLFQQASLHAVQAIEDAARESGGTARDYATTLLGAAVKESGRETVLATVWIGDGAIAAYGPRGQIRLMGTPDSGEFAGQTRFLDRATLADPGFATRIGIAHHPDLTAMLLLTDGVSDPCFETDNGLRDPARWDRLWDDLSPLLGAPDPERRLLDWLAFFSPGNHDDRTLAVLW
ncbi:PP2C family serine/threonine-protein phosphatase [Thiobaca trueperi]|uniref:Protein phosphatase 2C-like protein n=1 Tax=Thiobaca trueperi TaxID=127458 RepID=A0A4R3MXE1_9GAMM|nr:PP2C family serine/threonine-protein phosphatase [Thiobaca trueperi]TCT19413.1 protein phosphatase 2C-like protein [Thiobaca trueperi]